MQICGFKIKNAYLDDDGIVKKKLRRGVREDPIKFGKTLYNKNHTLAKLIALDRFLRSHQFSLQKYDYAILIDIAQKYLQVPRQSARPFAYTIWVIRH